MLNTYLKATKLDSETFANSGKDLISSKVIGSGERKADLYVIDFSSSFPASSLCKSFSVNNSFCSVSNNVTSQIWHHKLGHLSFQKLSFLKNQLQIDCTDHKDDALVPCLVCPLAKQRRLSYVSNNALDLDQLKYLGPYHTPTYATYKFFLTLVDDCTRFTWIYLMKEKFDAKSIIPNFLLLLKLNFTRKSRSFGLIMSRN
ncbi:unnamed protein product [Fraxinus pennsylvanica]|uniref:GAG-pre-integrase domain-containing protein n=1 Tax=Fraxinus pennsylvanica TaxID=56036 RepID=A0AAD2A222_9LAMI|nr:unnamed protein product [Fraxinus pennsylvanica]